MVFGSEYIKGSPISLGDASPHGHLGQYGQGLNPPNLAAMQLCRQGCYYFGHFLRLSEVKAKNGFGRSTIYALMANGDFPRSIRIGSGAVDWLESDIDQWIETRRAGATCGRG
jgi:prophage regulatory protein